MLNQATSYLMAILKSDFGLAKLLEDEESHITTIVAGTFGYLAPGMCKLAHCIQ
jgi:hypothetical protein